MMRFATPFLLAVITAGSTTQMATAEALPFPGLPLDIGTEFTLTNQWGETRTQADPDGHLQLVFFGYANCDAICTMALPQMGDIADVLAERGTQISTVMITIDGARDQPDTMAAPLADMHPRLIGLTGSSEALEQVYDGFQINIEHLFDDLEYGPIYAHDSSYYVLSGRGEFLTVLPPILSHERFADILEGYAKISQDG